MANFENKFKQKLEVAGYTCWITNSSWADNVPESEATEITVYDSSSIGVFKTFKLPKKKEVTVAWILDKWEKAENRESLGPILKEAIDKAGILPENSIDVYSTTYGIGVFVLFGEPKATYKRIKDWLDKNGIAWEKDFSPAGWVFRFKISKSQDNISRIRAIKG